MILALSFGERVVNHLARRWCWVSIGYLGLGQLGSGSVPLCPAARARSGICDGIVRWSI